MPTCWSVKSSVEGIPKVVIEHVLKSNDLIKDTHRNWSNRLMTPCWITFVYKRLKINMYKLCPYYILLSVSEILWKTQFHERSLWRHIEDQSHIQFKTNGTKRQSDILTLSKHTQHLFKKNQTNVYIGDHWGSDKTVCI